MRTSAFVPCCLLAVTCARATAQDPLLYVAVDSGLWSLNPDTGALHQVYGGVDLYNLSDGPAPGELYFTSSGQSLHRLNLATLTATDLQLHTTGNSLGLGPDGYIYNAAQDFLGTALYRIDPAAPWRTPILFGFPQFAGDLATTPSGELIGSLQNGDIVAINLFNGQIVPLASFPQLQFFGLAFTIDGRLWGTDQINRLHEIDLGSGIATERFSFPFPVLDLASQPVPAPGSALVVGAFLGLLAARRK